MTEAQWLACGDPGQMLLFRFESERETDRKFRLFACACCRIIWPLFPGEYRDRAVVLLSEAVADGKAGCDELRHARRHVISDAGPEVSTALDNAFEAAVNAARRARAAVGRRADDRAIGAIFQDRAAVDQTRLARDIFGNPFRPVAVDRAWLTSTVVQLARGIYNDHAFDRMPILADALQDAGCENENVLNHCRGRREGDPGEPAGGSPTQPTHARGCWVVDLLLGKT